MKSKHVVYFDDQGMPSSNGQQRSLPRLLEKIRDHAIEELQTLFVEMVDGADDALFDLAEKAAFNKDQSLYFDSMREVRIKRKGMENIFRQELKNAFLQLTVTTAGVAAGDVADLSVDSFSLVQEDELEEDLAIDAMVNRARNRNKAALEQIVTRFDTVMAGVRIEPSNNPVDPLKIATAFRVASKSLELDIKAKLIVFKLFERLVIAGLEDVYAEINAFLAKNGILPDLPTSPTSHKGRRSTAGHTPRADSAERRADAREASDDSTAAAPDSAGSEVLQVLQELLAVQRGGVGVGASVGYSATGIPLNAAPGLAAGAEAVPVVPTPELVRTLTNEQVQLLASAGGGGMVAAEVGVGAPKQDLRTQIGSIFTLPGQAIGQVNEDVIDIISMLFDFILDDNSLPDDIKALISRLQIPMLKVALIDKTFFSKGNHPARKLLNEMARAGVGWNSETAGSNGGLKEKIATIVATVLNEFEEDVSLFAQLLQDFQDFLQEQRKRAEIVERRTREAEEGKARSETARQNVRVLLDECTAGLELPEAVAKLLGEAWQNVLLLAFLREGPTGKSWLEAGATARELMASLQPPQDAVARKAMTAKLPLLIRELKTGLDAVAYSQFESARLFQELEGLHLRTLKGEHVCKPKVLENSASEHMASGTHAQPGDDVALLSSVADELLDLDEDVALSDDDEAQLERLYRETTEAAFQAQNTSAPVLDPPEAGPAVEPDWGMPDDIEEIELRAPGAFAPASSRQRGELPADDQYLQLVDNFQVGSWFELQDLQQALRCKLTAIIPTVGKYIFVNRTGVKVADFTRPGLALALRRGEMRQLNDGALFDRALESIISNLRSLKSQEDSL